MKPNKERRRRLLWRLYSAQDGKCFYCQKESVIRQADTVGKVKAIEATLDHKKPQSKGGTWSVENLALACFKCNHIKADGTIPDDILSNRPKMAKLFRSGEIKKFLIRG